jgi:hypothetical protein
VVLLPSEHAIQPCLSPFPIALDSHRRDFQDLSRFLNAQSAEVTQLDDAGFARIEFGEQLQRLIQGKDVDSPSLRPEEHLIQRHALRIAAALGIRTAARMVYQNSPDDLRAEGQKVRAVFTLDAAGSNQLEVSLIGHGCRLQRMAGLAAVQVYPGDPPELGIYDRHQAAQRPFIAIAPGGKQCRDVPWTADRHNFVILAKKKIKNRCTFCRQFPDYWQEVVQS